MRIPFSAVLFCLLISLFTTPVSAQETFEPLITENCALFVHVDYRKMEIDTIKARLNEMGEELLRELGFDQKSFRSTTRELKVELDKLDALVRPAFETLTKDLGINELAFVVDLELLNSGVPVFVAAPWKGKTDNDLEKLAELLQMSDPENEILAADGFLFISDNADWQESIQLWLESKKPSKEARIHEALESVKNDEIKFAAALPSTLRAMILNGGLLEDADIPKEVQGLLMFAIQKIEWASASISLAGLINDEEPLISNVLLTVKTAKRSDAVQLRSLMENSIEYGVNFMKFAMEQEEDMEFTMPPLFFEFVKGALRTLLPEIEGDRLIFRIKGGNETAQLKMNIVAVGGIGVALLLPAVQAAREAARRMQCTNKIKQIGIAFHNYHDTHGTLPPLYTVDEEGNPLHSWRVLILPYMERSALFDAIELDEPWDSEHNSQFHAAVGDVYNCPSCPLTDKNNCNFSVIAGGAFLPAKNAKFNSGMKFQDIKDGLSNTLAVVEVKTPFCWMDPTADISLADLEKGINVPDGRMGSFHPDGCNVGLMDGSVRFISKTIDKKVLKALATPDGKESTPIQ